MAAHYRSSAAQCAPALIIVPCGLNYTSVTPLWSQNTVVISVPADFMALNVFNHGDPGFFPLYGRKLYLKDMAMDPYLISSTLCSREIHGCQQHSVAGMECISHPVHFLVFW
jgi:hypothetical protein